MLNFFAGAACAAALATGGFPLVLGIITLGLIGLNL